MDVWTCFRFNNPELWWDYPSRWSLPQSQCSRPLTQKISRNPSTHHISQPESLQEFNSCRNSVRSHHKHTRAHLVKTLTSWPCTKHFLQKAGRASEEKWPEDRAAKTQKWSALSSYQNIPWSARPWTLHDCLFFIRPLLSGAGNKTWFSNTNNKTET